MAYDGNGVFNRLYNWEADAAAGINILAERMDQEMNGFAVGLSTALTRDGQAGMLANLDMGGFKITGLGDPAASNDAVNMKWATDRFLRKDQDDVTSGSLTVDGGNVVIRSADPINTNLWFRDVGGINGGVIFYDRSNASMVFRRYKGGNSDTQIELGDVITPNRSIKFPSSGYKIEWSDGDYIDWQNGIGLIGYENGGEVFRLQKDVEASQYLVTLASRVYFGGRSDGASPDYIRWIAGQGLYGYENGNEVWRLTTNGTATRINGVGTETTSNAANVHSTTAGVLYRSTSSGKFKTDVQNIVNGLDLIGRLRPVTFKSLHKGDSPDRSFMGFIAEEVITVMPWADVEGDNYDVRAVVAALVAAVKELDLRVKEIAA
jgi:hypothetical protein